MGPTLEGSALEALIDGDEETARELIRQLYPFEAVIVAATARRLAAMASIHGDPYP